MPEIPLTLHTLQNVNARRAERWHPDGIGEWSLPEWFTALAGEVGELGGAIKERLRNRDGATGKGLTDDQITQAISDEIADVLAYLAALATSEGIDLARAYSDKFNRVSEKHGFPERVHAIEYMSPNYYPDEDSAITGIDRRSDDEHPRNQMTVLCAARDSKGIALAADGQTTAGGLIITDTKPKIWRQEVGGADWLFAGTGAVRYIQVVQHQFTPPHGDETDLAAYMVRTFVPQLRTTLQSAGLEHKLNEVSRAHRVALLVARGDQIFTVDTDYCVIAIDRPIWADGSGYGFAIGAMHATPKTKAADIARAGVEAAITYDAYCSGTIQVETLPAS